MTEYSVQPNFHLGTLSRAGLSPIISAMPKTKRGPYQKRPITPPSDMRLIYLKPWRIKKGLTVEELADAAEMSPSNVSEMENLKQGYSPRGLVKLAKALGITTGQLLNMDPRERSGEALWQSWATASEEQKQQIAEIAATIVRRGQ